MHTEKQAQALKMHREGKSLREIGDALNVKRATARELVTRAQLVERQTAWATGLPTRYVRLLMSLGINTLAALRDAIDKGRLRSFPGIGPQVESAITEWARKQ